MTPPGRVTESSVPVGTLIAYAGELARTGTSPRMNETSIDALGWMECDGRLLDAHVYPELFAALGYRYGGADYRFRIPDYRGAVPFGMAPAGDVHGPSILIKVSSSVITPMAGSSG